MKERTRFQHGCGRRAMRPGSRALLLAGSLLLPACAAQKSGVPSATRPEVRSAARTVMLPSIPQTPPALVGDAAILQRLPPRLGAWVRASTPAGAEADAVMARYVLPNTGAWATIFPFGRESTPVPDGLASPPVALALQDMIAVAQGNAGGGAIEERIARVPDAPPQRCAIARAVRGTAGVANYGCATGVGGQVLRVRVTGSFRPGVAADTTLLDSFVVMLLQDVTRAVVNLPPVRPVASQQGNAVTLTLPQFEPAARLRRL